MRAPARVWHGGPRVQRASAGEHHSPDCVGLHAYAISTEWWSQLGYDGKAKADANIWSGTRIIQVCMWYTRGGAKVSDTVCSNAASTGGSWLSGPVKTMSVWDSLDPNAPHTDSRGS